MDSPNESELQIDNQDELDALFEDGDDEDNDETNNDNKNDKKNKSEDLFGSDDEEGGDDDDLNLSLERVEDDTHTEQIREQKRRSTSQSADIQEFYENPYPPKDTSLIRVKLPNILSIQPKPFDPITFNDDELFEDRSGVVGLESVIRWRWVKDKYGELLRESNAKIYKWSDGSMYLHLGTEILEVNEHDLGGEHAYIFSRSQPSILSCHGRIDKKITLRPRNASSKFHNRLTKTMAEVSKKVTRVRLVSTTADPEKEKARLELQEEERIKSIQKLETGRQSVLNKYRVTNDYLEREEEYHEDEDLENKNNESIDEEKDLESLFDNRHSRTPPSSKKRQYRDEEEEAQKLLKAKSSSVTTTSTSKKATLEDEEDIDVVALPNELEESESVVKKTKRGRAIIDDDDE